jgi:hypothetical protein
VSDRDRLSQHFHFTANSWKNRRPAPLLIKDACGVIKSPSLFKSSGPESCRRYRGDSRLAGDARLKYAHAQTSRAQVLRPHVPVPALRLSHPARRTVANRCRARVVSQVRSGKLLAEDRTVNVLGRSGTGTRSKCAVPGGRCVPSWPVTTRTRLRGQAKRQASRAAPVGKHASNPRQ